ncbi:MAG: hypothetical protein HY782_12385 [Chloroflexi bacterium]|nr:hypothetical protein [Chloroflexota bacterium]
MTRAELERELQDIQAELEEVEEMRRAVLGQTGVHVGARLLQQHRARFDRDQARLEARVAEIRALLDALEQGSAQ